MGIEKGWRVKRGRNGETRSGKWKGGERGVE